MKNDWIVDSWITSLLPGARWNRVYRPSWLTLHCDLNALISHNCCVDPTKKSSYWASNQITRNLKWETYKRHTRKHFSFQHSLVDKAKTPRKSTLFAGKKWKSVRPALASVPLFTKSISQTLLNSSHVQWSNEQEIITKGK